ncbi:PIN domain-containing protein [Sphingobium sp. 3R8]|uniref:PIN domain-containing protein n=1 Tax=Sphingobium sp. 3R8 TaxID=2874921 RepID=UPI001CCC5E83|nr:PIN domain-containing protein [Sphingobium sp. 3R8]MBZ9647609.1 PIN domain-containing protein [Sphingobium sp. 3R8]
MPVWTEEQLDAAIAAHEIGFITLDTSIFDKFGCNLRYRALQRLDQFKGAGVSVIFSDMIAGEVRAHIVKEAREKAANLKAALNQYRKAWHRPETGSALAPAVDLDGDAVLHAQAQWDAFLGVIGAEMLESEGRVSLRELRDRYFLPLPPFSEKDGKKSEFPDAIALMALEHLAREKHSMVLAVSRDGDWHDFAEQSAYIVVVDDLAKMLERYNLAGVLIAQRLVLALAGGTAPELAQMIESEIGSWLENCDFTPDGESEFIWEAMPSAASLDGWEVEDGPSVVSLDEDELTFSIDLSCQITFEADFDLQIRDGVDKDYVSMGSTAASKTETRTINVTVICAATEDDNYEPYEVEMNRQHLHIDFGRVEPDWWDRD